MIGPQDELPKHGQDARQDALTIDVCDLERGVCALLRLVRTVDDTAPTSLAIVCLDGEDVAGLGGAIGVEIEVIEPLARWRASLQHGDVTLEVELDATSPPIDFEELAGIRRYEQLCRARGTLGAGGRRIDIDGAGRYAHAWGEPRAARFRSVWAVAPDRAMTVTAVRPPGAAQHGEESIAAYVVRPESSPERVEEARLSTVYDDAGRPRTAGLELLLEGDEFPRRASGEAACHAAVGPVQAACFRWSLDGEPAQGGYQVVSPA
jgi:hypothetical protein